MENAEQYKEIALIISNDINAIINYSDEDVLKCGEYWTDTQLDLFIVLTSDMESQYNTAQMVAKILMNSLYGALGNAYFPLFNESIAQAITGNGRYFIRKLANYIEEALQTLHKSDKPYITYGDTDSVIGDTVVRTSIGDIKIEDLYNDLIGDVEKRGDDNFIKHLKPQIKAASVSQNKELQYNNINYIMKHKVKKRMFKVKCNGDEVIVTEDHSVMVIRDNELISVKAFEIRTGDKLVKLK